MWYCWIAAVRQSGMVSGVSSPLDQAIIADPTVSELALDLYVKQAASHRFTCPQR